MTARVRLAVLLSASLVALAGCGDSRATTRTRPAARRTRRERPRRSELADEPDDGRDPTTGGPSRDSRHGAGLLRRRHAAGRRGCTASSARSPADNRLGAALTSPPPATRSTRTTAPCCRRAPFERRHLRRADRRSAPRRLVDPAARRDDRGRGAARRPAARLHGAGRPADADPGRVHRLDGEPADRRLRLRARVAFTRAPTRSRRWRWSTSPRPRRASRRRDTFTASGVASSFEATVPWEIRQGDPTARWSRRASRPPRAGWTSSTPGRPRSTSPTWRRATYTFVAMTDDPSDGEGAGPTEDSKTITVP